VQISNAPVFEVRLVSAGAAPSTHSGPRWVVWRSPRWQPGQASTNWKARLVFCNGRGGRSSGGRPTVTADHLHEVAGPHTDPGPRPTFAPVRKTGQEARCIRNDVPGPSHRCQPWGAGGASRNDSGRWPHPPRESVVLINRSQRSGPAASAPGVGNFAPLTVSVLV